MFFLLLFIFTSMCEYAVCGYGCMYDVCVAVVLAVTNAYKFIYFHLVYIEIGPSKIKQNILVY